MIDLLLAATPVAIGLAVAVLAAAFISTSQVARLRAERDDAMALLADAMDRVDELEHAAGESTLWVTPIPKNDQSPPSCNSTGSGFQTHL